MEWPSLPLEEWVDTRDTLHRWTQIVGKIRMTLTPLINHWWNVPLYVTARGLTTSSIPYGDRWFDMELDFVAHVLRVRSSDGGAHATPLGPRSVADLHRAPARERADAMTAEAYSHEVSSVGFWPGDSRLAKPAFYSYAAPEPAGYRDSVVRPAAVHYYEPLGGFYLDYDDMRAADDPRAM